MSQTFPVDGEIARDEARRLNREVIVVLSCVWLAELAISVSRAAYLGAYADAGSMLARVAGACVGAGLAYSTHLLLRRFRFRMLPGRFAAATAAAAAACTLFMLADQLLFFAFSARYRATVGGLDAHTFVNDLLFVWVFVAWGGLYTALSYNADLRTRDRRIAEIEAMAQRAQLEALRFQLNPHFLFNTLNSLSGLVRLGRAGEAERAILSLSALLRHTIEAGPTALTPLKDEIAAQTLYFDIEQLRFGDRLELAIEVAEDLGGVLVPNLILQPLIENAVKHGVAQSATPVAIRIEARRVGADVEIAVENSAPDTTSATTSGFGIGLENVRRRLEATYGDTAALSAASTASGGWRSVIRLPARF
ncbi:MAG: histidine kinase [Proteobacteria bacterium]|nr:histidine kinase [Pseudomonadota bacterium]